jgi:hypothetical protein
MASAVALHAFGWAVNLRHYLTDLSFQGQYPPGWQPAGGVPLWSAVLAGAAVLAIVGFGRVTASAKGRPTTPDRSPVTDADAAWQHVPAEVSGRSRPVRTR